MRNEKRFFRCANTDESEVPDHSNNPLSRETPNVISVGTVGTSRALRKAIKFAILVLSAQTF